MHVSTCIAAGALAFAGLIGLATTAQASPHSGSAAIANVSAPSLIQKVSGCHQNRQYHMVYKWNTPAWHRHRRNCAPVAANPPAPATTHCHRGWQSHPHPAQGGRGSHRHVGPNCAAVWR